MEDTINKLELLKREREEIKEIPTENESTKCDFCLKEFKDQEVYYFCVIHRFNYCDSCAKNYYKRKIEYRKAPNCSKKIVDFKNCIAVKKLAYNPNYHTHGEGYTF